MRTAVANAESARRSSNRRGLNGRKACVYSASCWEFRHTCILTVVKLVG